MWGMLITCYKKRGKFSVTVKVETSENKKLNVENIIFVENINYHVYFL